MVLLQKPWSTTFHRGRGRTSTCGWVEYEDRLTEDWWTLTQHCPTVNVPWTSSPSVIVPLGNYQLLWQLTHPEIDSTTKAMGVTAIKLCLSNDFYLSTFITEETRHQPHHSSFPQTGSTLLSVLSQRRHFGQEFNKIYNYAYMAVQDVSSICCCVTSTLSSWRNGNCVLVARPGGDCFQCSRLLLRSDTDFKEKNWVWAY